ncbi:MAG TPA: helix-turn-helix domain-containing protein, partial [Gaiellaceae bacterium]|nr:helix-turn-helix domain-containing protein [Gaiellaceae bacterium]
MRPHVIGYSGYREETGMRTRQREPLSTNAVVIFGLNSTIRVDGGDLGTFVGGLSDTAPVVEHDGVMSGIQVDLTPLGARMLFGVPMHELARRSVALEDVIGVEARRLEERLHDAATWDERFAIVEDALARRLESATPPPPDVTYAWNRLAETQGRERVEALAQSIGSSRKHLAARFREHVGLPPKLVTRTMRFRRAIDLLTSLDPPPLDELAFTCGYYDQS